MNSTDPGGSGVDDFTLKVAAILKREHEQSDLSYQQIAEATGLSKMTVLRVMNGRRPITALYLHLLCTVMGIKAGDVLNEADST